MSQKKEKLWFEISEDELASRMVRHQIMYNEPIKKASAMVFYALEKVLALLGVNPDWDIPTQQEALGIHLIPMHPTGMTVATSTNGELDSDPFAWISGAEIKHTGDIYCCAEIYKGKKEGLLMEFFCNVRVQDIKPLGKESG